MRIIKFILALAISCALVYLLNTNQNIGGKPIPALGKFLSPSEGFWQNIEADSVPASGDFHLAGLQGAVSVHYDSDMIPHILADHENDAYFMQGYITAQHRLWHMELQILSAAGRISEIIGPVALEADRLNRRKGLVFGAENGLHELEKNPRAKAMLDSYTAGINAWIGQLDPEDYPIEYKLLNYAPEKWTPLKSILLLKYMSNSLSNYDTDLEQTNLLSMLGREDLDLLFPIKPQDVDPVIPEGTVFDFEPERVDTPTISFPLTQTRNLQPKPNPANGSNNFTVSGQKTMSGNPILANEPDLGLNLPSLWFVLQMQAPGLNVMGASLPGAPGVIIGFNDSIAWGVTNARRDVRDWYQIQFRNEDREEYRYGDQWLKVQRRVEVIKVRGQEDIIDTVLYTHHGPVTYEEGFDQRKGLQGFATRWPGHDPSLEIHSFYQLNRAGSVDDFLAALESYVGPAQNFIFASAKGDIALQISGRFPKKWKDQGRFLMDGSNPEHDWQGYIPYDHSARAINPDQGYLSSANQYPVPSNYPYYSYDPIYEHYRNRRINQVLDSADMFTQLDARKLQNDNLNLMAKDLLPFLLDSLDRTGIEGEAFEIMTVLESWDYIHDPESQGAVYFDLWEDHLNDLIWDEFENPDVPVRRPTAWRTIELLKLDTAKKYFDILSTSQVETANDLIRISFDQMVQAVAKWKENNSRDLIWMNYNNHRVTHLLRQPAFSHEYIDIGGTYSTVNAANGGHGPSWRMVVELGPEVKAWGIYPGGQSGNPGSRWYDNMIERWARGEYMALQFVPRGGLEPASVMASQSYSPETKEN